jgi:hypothetical protein
MKVGDKVKALVGPHKGQAHRVIHVFENGNVNIQPIGLRPSQIRYGLGAAQAKPFEVELIND